MAASSPFAPVPHPHEIKGHPTTELYLVPEQEPTLITVCAQCGNLRTVLFLNKDRWFCFRCKMTGSAPPNLYPVS